MLLLARRKRKREGKSVLDGLFVGNVFVVVVVVVAAVVLGTVLYKVSGIFTEVEVLKWCPTRSIQATQKTN